MSLTCCHDAYRRISTTTIGLQVKELKIEYFCRCCNKLIIPTRWKLLPTVKIFNQLNENNIECMEHLPDGDVQIITVIEKNLKKFHAFNVHCKKCRQLINPSNWALI